MAIPVNAASRLFRTKVMHVVCACSDNNSHASSLCGMPAIMPGDECQQDACLQVSSIEDMLQHVRKHGIAAQAYLYV